LSTEGPSSPVPTCLDIADRGSASAGLGGQKPTTTNLQRYFSAAFECEAKDSVDVQEDVMSTLGQSITSVRRMPHTATHQQAATKRVGRCVVTGVLALTLAFLAMLGQNTPASAFTGNGQGNPGSIAPQRMVGWGVCVGSGYAPSI
jgi:hypothetical protein